MSEKPTGVPADDIRGEEIAALLNEIKQRVRARYPSGSAPFGSGVGEPVRVPLADLMPLVHARDAAQAKVAAIGSVNPRPSGLFNSVAQAVKRAVSRGMGWFVRDQIVFNRETLTCVEAVMEALNDLNLSISSLAAEFTARVSEQSTALQRVSEEIPAVRDLELHWNSWRVEFERNLQKTETSTLRAMGVLEANFRDAVRLQHSDYLVSLERGISGLQERFWADMERVRLEYERIIQSELRTLRQRMFSHPPSPAAGLSAVPQVAPPFDYQRFAEQFRGSEEYVRRGEEFYLPYFAGCKRVLDIGCGRGEFLEAIRAQGIEGEGIDLSEECAAYCRAKGLNVQTADLFEFLAAQSEYAFDGIFSSQVVEHIDPMRLAEMIRLCASRLRRGGVLALETPNPECLAIFASHFYLDPTHRRPVPSALLSFYMVESGMGGMEVHPLSPAAKSFPEIEALPAGFAQRFFGGLDYAIIGRKL